MILTIRTDKPEAKVRLLDKDGGVVAEEAWTAHRQLGETIHKKIDEQLQKANIKLGNLTGIVIYEGPGSFTGLRIGMSVANALAYSLKTPIIATTGDDWQQNGAKKLANTKTRQYVQPKYGADANITKPKR